MLQIPIDTDLYWRAEKAWGQGSQLGMLYEEMGELMAAVNQWDRGRKTATDVMEEVADVMIMIGQLMSILTKHNEIGIAKEVEGAITRKLLLLRRRVITYESTQ